MGFLNIFKSRKTVLVVDDNQDVVQLLSIALDSAGFKVFVAGDAKSGLEMLSKNNVELIISDINMPGMNGIEFLQAVRRLPEYKTKPAVLISGYYPPSELEKLKTKLKNIFVFQKPLDIPSFVKTVKDAV